MPVVLANGIVHSKQLVFFDAVIVYHKGIFRGQILDNQIGFALFCVNILKSEPVNRQIQTVIPVRLVCPGKFQRLRQCSDVCAALVGYRIPNKITGCRVRNVLCMVTHQLIFALRFIQYLMLAFIIPFIFCKLLSKLLMRHNQQPDCLLVRCCFVPLVRGHCKLIHPYHLALIKAVFCFIFHTPCPFTQNCIHKISYCVHRVVIFFYRSVLALLC